MNVIVGTQKQKIYLIHNTHKYIVWLLSFSLKENYEAYIEHIIIAHLRVPWHHLFCLDICVRLTL